MKTKIEPSKSPVSEGLILVCEKCGKNMGYGDDNNPARDLQKSIKEKIKDAGKKGVVRAVITGCMDLCPKNEIVVCFSRTGKGDEYVTVSGETEDLAKTLLAKM